MTAKQHSPDVEKLLTYVFEDDSPLPTGGLELADGLFLAELPPFLLQQDDSYYLQYVEPHFSQFFRHHLHKTTLNIAYTGRSDLSEEGRGSAEEDSYRKAHYYLFAAMLHAPQFVPPRACFVTAPAVEKVYHSKRMMEFGALNRGSKQALGEDDFSATSTIYLALNQVLSPDATGRLPTALAYYHQAFRSDISWPVRFLSMMIGIEALFSHGATEVSHQVSERTAFFLRNEPAEREKLYQQLRGFYAMRSGIVHGGTAKGKKTDLDQSFQELLLLLRESLLKVLGDHGLLDLFQSATSKEFSAAMKTLVFRGQIEIES